MDLIKGISGSRQQFGLRSAGLLYLEVTSLNIDVLELLAKRKTRICFDRTGQKTRCWLGPSRDAHCK